MASDPPNLREADDLRPLPIPPHGAVASTEFSRIDVHCREILICIDPGRF
jgi:hypothetical protein